MLRRMMMAGGNGGGGEDPYWASVVALLHFDGENGSTAFYDEKLAGNWTGHGNAQISTTQSRYGGASLLLDGTGDWIDTPDTAAWAFGSGDFFIEASIYIPDTTGVKAIISQWGNSLGDRSWVFYVSGSTLTLAVNIGYNIFASANGVTANTWHDVACGRVGNRFYVWLNGVRSTGYPYSGTLQNTSNVICIGAENSSGKNPFKGYIDEVRVRALAGPDGNYTPSGPFPNG